MNQYKKKIATLRKVFIFMRVFINWFAETCALGISAIFCLGRIYVFISGEKKIYRRLLAIYRWQYHSLLYYTFRRYFSSTGRYAEPPTTLPRRSWRRKVIVTRRISGPSAVSCKSYDAVLCHDDLSTLFDQVAHHTEPIYLRYSLWLNGSYKIMAIHYLVM